MLPLCIWKNKRDRQLSCSNDRAHVWKDAMVNFRYVITACERSRQESFGCWACCTTLLSSEETAARLRAGSLAKSTGPSFHGWLRTCHYRRVLVRDAKLRSDRSQNHRFDLKKSIDEPLPVRKNRSQNRQTTSNAANLVLGPRKDRCPFLSQNCSPNRRPTFCARRSRIPSLSPTKLLKYFFCRIAIAKPVNRV